ncbi:MAG: hypothetical protein AB7K04_03960 [Pseudorhodoplanes sp.]
MLTQDQQDAMRPGLPNRAAAQPGDIVATVLFLASEEAGQVMGQTVAVGGMS